MSYWLIERGSPAEWWVRGMPEVWTQKAHEAQKFNEWGARTHAKELESWGVQGPLRATEHIDLDDPAEPVGGSPRTDAAAFKQNDGTTRYSTTTGAPLKVVSADFARQLERELDVAVRMRSADARVWSDELQALRVRSIKAEIAIVEAERELAHANKELDEWDYSYWTKQVEEWREKVKTAESAAAELRAERDALRNFYTAWKEIKDFGGRYTMQMAEADLEIETLDAAIDEAAHQEELKEGQK